MQFNFAEDVEDFRRVVNEECQSNVWLKSIYGDKYNIKSALSQYIAIAKLIEDNPECQLELWADNKDDEAVLMKFLKEHPRVIGNFNLSKNKEEN